MPPLKQFVVLFAGHPYSFVFVHLVKVTFHLGPYLQLIGGGIVHL